jgi:hypothetical protein
MCGCLNDPMNQWIDEAISNLIAWLDFQAYLFISKASKLNERLDLQRDGWHLLGVRQQSFRAVLADE